MMKRLGLVLFAALLCATMAFGYKTGTVSLDQLLGVGMQDGLVVGDKVFYNFSFNMQSDCGGGTGCSHSPTSAASVDVIPYLTGPYGISFHGSFLARSTGPTLATTDVLLEYWVSTFTMLNNQLVVGPSLINGIGQRYTMNISGNGGWDISITEDVYRPDGSLVATSRLTFSDTVDPPGESVQLDNLVIHPPLNTVHVVKDILMIADPACPPKNSNCGLSNTAGLSIVTQTVYQVPEPGFYGMLALGLSGLVLAFRRRRAN